MILKYQESIRGIENCPPDRYAGRQFTAFRFVFADIAHSNNFRPVLAIKPTRIHSPQFLSERARCMGYALSLFDSLDSALRRYRQISRYNKNFHKSVGTHIAEGAIARNDGVASRVDHSGHVTLHESIDADLASKFAVVSEAYHVG